MVKKTFCFNVGEGSPELRGICRPVLFYQFDVFLNIASLNLDYLVFVTDERLNLLELCVL